MDRLQQGKFIIFHIICGQLQVLQVSIFGFLVVNGVRLRCIQGKIELLEIFCHTLLLFLRKKYITH